MVTKVIKIFIQDKLGIKYCRLMFLESLFIVIKFLSFCSAVSNQYFLVVGDIACDKHTVVYRQTGNLSRGLYPVLV